MKNSDDVTQWLQKLGDGDDAAQHVIMDHYFQKVVRLARRKLEGLALRAADEEDVALSAMRSLFRGIDNGRFAHLDDRDCLWRLLVTLTRRKAIKEIRHERAQKRGGGHVRGESIFQRGDDSEGICGIDMIAGEEATSRIADHLAESCRTMLEKLPDETLKKIALLKMEGFTNHEIAAKLEVTERTIERKLARIRQLWQADA